MIDRLYIDQNDANAKTGAVQMVKNLTALISGATIGDLAGLEELIGILVKGNDIDKNCYQVMWQVFTKVMPDTTDEQSQAALVLLGMVSSLLFMIITVEEVLWTHMIQKFPSQQCLMNILFSRLHLLSQLL